MGLHSSRMVVLCATYSSSATSPPEAAAAAGNGAAAKSPTATFATSAQDDEGTQGILGRPLDLPPDVLRKVVEQCCCFMAAKPDTCTALALMGTCRALGRVVIASAPRRTLTHRLPPEGHHHHQWPPGLTSLVHALSPPPDLNLVIRSQSDHAHARLRSLPPEPLWPFVSFLRLFLVEVTQQDLAAMRLHQWPRLKELAVESCAMLASTSASGPATAAAASLSPPSQQQQHHHLHHYHLQPVPHLRTLSVKPSTLHCAQELAEWMPLSRGPNLRLVALSYGRHLEAALRRAPHVTHVEVASATARDLRCLARLPQLQHVAVDPVLDLSEDLSALPCPWASMRLRCCSVRDLLRLPLGPNLQTLAVRDLAGSDDPAVIAAALGRLRRLPRIRVAVEGLGPGSQHHWQWRLPARERLLRLNQFDAELLRWAVRCACPEATAVALANPAVGWVAALQGLLLLKGDNIASGDGGGRSSRSFTVCLHVGSCGAEVAATLPACVRAVRVRSPAAHLVPGLGPFVAALPAHVGELTVLCEAFPPAWDVGVLRRGCLNRQPPLVVRCEVLSSSG